MKYEGYFPAKKVKHILEDYLFSQGWTLDSDGYDNSDIDLVVKRGAEKWRIQAKGSEPSSEEIINSFVSVLGQILQRMDNDNCRYSIALPDTKQFRRLWERLPELAKDRLELRLYSLVNQDL